MNCEHCEKCRRKFGIITEFQESLYHVLWYYWMTCCQCFNLKFFLIMTPHVSWCRTHFNTSYGCSITFISVNFCIAIHSSSSQIFSVIWPYLNTLAMIVLWTAWRNLCSILREKLKRANWYCLLFTLYDCKIGFVCE